MSMTNPFAPAVKEQLKARIALSGPAGAGKTYTALRMATALAQGGKIAVVDTERRSASLYADVFNFDANDFIAPYVPQRLIDTMRAAEAHGYAVCIIDSGTHFWSGPGGILEIVDKNAKGGNSWSGWAVGTPIQQALIDTMLSVNMHVIMCMRSKQEWALVENDKGRKEPTRIGMAPQQRGDIEYEFTVFAELDLDHRLTVTKTRCPLVAGLVDVNPGEQFAGTLLDWLNDGADPDEKYRAAGWTDQGEHNTARTDLINRGRALNPDQQQSFREARTEARLPSLSGSAFYTKPEVGAIRALFDRYDTATGDATGSPTAVSGSEGSSEAPEPPDRPDSAASVDSEGTDPREDQSYQEAVEAWVAAQDNVAVNAQLLARQIVPETKGPKGMRAALVTAIIAAGEVPEGMVLPPTE